MTTQEINAKGSPKEAYDAFVGRTLEQLKTALYVSTHKDKAKLLIPFERSEYLDQLAEPVAFLASLADEQITNNKKFPRIGLESIRALNIAFELVEKMEFPVVELKTKE